jgi:hypothetical protein
VLFEEECGLEEFIRFVSFFLGRNFERVRIAWMSCCFIDVGGAVFVFSEVFGCCLLDVL